MLSADDLSRMLTETVSILESTNLIQLAPTEVVTWYRQKQLDEEIDCGMSKTEAEKFIDEQVEKWERRKEAIAENQEGQFPS